MVNISENLTLKACRMVARIRAAELAKSVGVSQSTLYRWEKGESHPTGDQMAGIVHCFAEHGYLVDINDINFFA